MYDTPQDEIDMAIEAALGNERMLVTPITLHRRVMERVRFAAMRERERVRFRFCMTSLAVALLGALATAFLVIAVTNLNVYLHYGVAGGKGQYDYLATSLALQWTSYSGAYSLVLSLLLACGRPAAGADSAAPDARQPLTRKPSPQAGCRPFLSPPYSPIGAIARGVRG